MKGLLLSITLSMMLATGIGTNVNIPEVSDENVEILNEQIEIDISEEEQALNEMNTYLLELINNLRAEKGLNSLEAEEWLEDIASIRSIEASSCWSHTRPDGTSSLDMIPINMEAGENLSYCTYNSFDYTDEECKAYADKVFDMLVNSPSHYENMICSRFKTIGIKTYVSKTEEGKIKLCSAYIFSN